MSFFKHWAENYEQAMRSKVLVELKSLPKEHLEVAGISPELLELGVSAWPWRNAEVQENQLNSKAVKEVSNHAQQSAANMSGTFARTVTVAREFDSAA